MDFEKTRGSERERFVGFDENQGLIGQNLVSLSHILFISMFNFSYYKA